MIQRLRCLFLFFTLCSSATAIGRNHSRMAYDEPEHEWGFNTYVQINHVFYKAGEGDMMLAFPYRIDNRNGYFTGHAYNGTGGTFFAFGIEVSHRDISFDANISPFSLLGSSNLSDGYIGITWRCHYETFVPTMADFSSSILSLPISFSVGVQDYNAGYRAGKIRVDSTERFHAFGSDMGLSEDEDEHGFVTVFAEQMTFALVPTVNLGYRPLMGNFQVFVRFGPFIPFYNKTGLSFAYRDEDFDDGSMFPRFGVIDLRNAGVHATYNGERTIPDNPFPVSGWMLSVRVSFGTPDMSRWYRHWN